MNHTHSTTTKRRERPALRLIGTKDLSRNDWLAVRKTGIGSSDAAAAVGLNLYKSQLELWLEKTGRDTLLPKINPLDEESPTYWGNILEPIVATHYTQRTGNRVRRINAVLQHSDPQLEWMLANIDREVIGTNEVQILECKTAGINGARLWKEGVPICVQLQVIHQLAVTGKQAADVAVLLGGQHLEIHHIKRDDELITRLIELERDFWSYVQRDTPPPADGSESADQALRCLYPEDHGQRLDFTQDLGLSAAFAELQSVRANLDTQIQREAELKQQLQQAMGDASRATFANGSVSWRKAKDRVVLDVPALLKEKPYLLARYPTTKTGSRRFLIS
ncbi:TPA: YqaJ viral recombinase family protein [Pseudomonas aeruginosa]|uniref:YqaJ viral recombinase family nuclease n=1 Tax=Pseudomonas aeruginosa TaxID=287 RepID=UPI001CC152D3|nr:YqaJ viral recombinase family protein [Pseudomonas aeruginosa]MCS9379239.1 YqaJ viral recombinase family protein [Pseudomonas aeruginosa]HBP6280103.1 alkaline phosphatase [Pseudomonas aeruginosa]HCL4344357.1 YqaJ viral recombinase family protein [Pseudomonas aeruginosa]HEK2085070.1 YqaJ viral recombinase family protein [Pseudomonas aeruginosa]